MIQKINPNYDSLEKLLEELADLEGVECKIKRDRWSDELVANKKCIVVKKSKLHGAKIRFVETNVVNVLGIAPSHLVPDRGFLSYFIHLAIRKGQSEVVLKTMNHLKKLDL